MATIQVDTELRISESQHDHLVKHLKKLLTMQKDFHDSQVEKFAMIDKAIYGYLVPDADDEKRLRENQKGYGVKTVDTILPLAQTQLDNAVTYFMEVLTADTGLYAAQAPRDKQPIANAFSALLNEHGDNFGHEKEYNKLFFDGMKYNFGAIETSWKTVRGAKLTNRVGGGVEIEETEVYAGNKLKAIDLYNFYYDLSVSPTDLHSEGEFYATIALKSPYKVKKLIQDKELYNLDSLIESEEFSITWYTPKPTIRTVYSSSQKATDWMAVLGGVDGTSTTDKAVELATFNVWLPTKKFGITNSKQEDIYRLCRVVLANNTKIARVQILNNAHGSLPIGVVQPIEDGFREDTKSFGELLLPFQTFASAQMNTHQKSNRRATYGLTFYNKNVINLDDNYDPIAAKIAVNASPDVDLRKAIHQVYDGPDTANTMRDIDAVTNLMQQILPTEILKQVAGLDRATQYQAAATVQGANRRNLKIAKLLNIQCLSPVKRQLMYNVLQYQSSMELLSPEGDLVEVDPSEFRDTKMEFTISDGLRGLDRLSMAMSIKEILNSILQSQSASEKIDVVAVINYWTSMLGDNTSFAQFKFKSEIDKLSPEMKDLAFQLLQKAMQEQEDAGGNAGAGQQQLGAVQ